MLKYFIIFLTLIITSNCTGKDTEDNELKSPCVSIDVTSSKAPCQRRPANRWLG